VTRELAPDPTALFELATGFWASATLLAAEEVGVFHVLTEAPRTASEAAQALGADRRALERLLDACSGLNLLVKQGERYLLSPLAAAYLVPGAPGGLASGIAWARDQYAAWGRLAETVRTGRPAVDPGDHLGGDPEQARRFVLAMHERAAGIARAVVGSLNLDGVERLLDVGAGPGTYAVLLARRHPGLSATLLDLPPILDAARELVDACGVAERIALRPGDASSGQYGEEAFDAVLFSGVLHQMPPETIRRMLEGAFRALVPGGRVFLSDILADATHTRPVFSALFSLQMLLTTEGGGVFSVEECRSWLEQAGFAEIEVQRLPAPLPYTVVSALRPRALV